MRLLVGLYAAQTFVGGMLNVLIVAVTSYVTLIVIASFATASRYGWALLPVLPVTFAAYHFGYGIGFLNGLLDFVVLRRTQPRRSMARLTR